MKKFFTDNLWLFVIIALAGAGYAVWQIRKSKNESEGEETAIELD